MDGALEAEGDLGPAASAEKRASEAAPPQSKTTPADRAAAEEAYTLGMVHYVQGDAAKALPFFEKAHQILIKEFFERVPEERAVGEMRKEFVEGAGIGKIAPAFAG